MKTILLCPGQGAQTVGMAKELIETIPEARALFEKANDILGLDIAKLCVEGPADELNRTRNTQPALYLHSCAAIDRLRAAGVSWDAAAGHSAGEYAALYALEVWSFEEGLRVIAERARLMDEAAAQRGGTMAVSLGLHPDRVAEICDAIDETVVLANRNAPIQGVISGAKEGVEAASGALKEAGAKRVLPLKVSGAFHSPLMGEAQGQFSEFLASRPEGSIRTPVGEWISNRTGQPESDPSGVPTSLAGQLTSPVHWLESMAFLNGCGELRCIEAGCGNVLRGLLKSNGVAAAVWGAATPRELDQIASEVNT